MGKESVLVWNSKADGIYREARRQIMSRNNIAPKTVRDIDFASFFAKNAGKLAYFPVFQGTTGWWGELLGTGAKIQSKTIVSPECQLYEVGLDGPLATNRALYAAEISPRGCFLQKMRAAAITIKDMIATDSGTILTLLVGGGEGKIKNYVKLAGGEFFGSLGGY